MEGGRGRAAQVVLGTRALFSDQALRNLLDPPAPGARAAREAHHLFPEAWLNAASFEHLIGAGDNREWPVGALFCYSCQNKERPAEARQKKWVLLYWRGSIS
jgi:hypothetical protein